MAESDILNPTTQFWPDLGDSPNPSYGYSRKSSANTALAKARLGPPYSRDTLNDGFAFPLRFTNRPWSTILRLEHFYKQYKRGFFTYIDHDGGGRHHVGRFATPIESTHLGNGIYTVQQVIFQEIPGARMLKYPDDFENWSAQLNVLDDFLKPTVALYSVTPNAWVAQIDPSIVPAPDANDSSGYEFFNANPALSSLGGDSDYAQIQYVGWGFQIRFRTASGLGQVAVFIDGVYLRGVFDLGSGARVADGSGFLPALPDGATYVNGILTVTKMPLDMHRIKIVPYAAGTGTPFPIPAGQGLTWALPNATANTGSSGTGVSSSTAASLGPVTMATGAVAVTESRPLGAHDNGCSWSDFSLISTALPLDAVIQGIYPVMIASASDPDSLIEYLAYGAGVAVGSPGGSGFAHGPIMPTAPKSPGATIATSTFYGASIGNTLADLTGMGMVAQYSDSLFTDGLSDTITVRGVGFAIVYESATPSIDGSMYAGLGGTSAIFPRIKVIV